MRNSFSLKQFCPFQNKMSPVGVESRVKNVNKDEQKKLKTSQIIKYCLIPYEGW